jgi:UDP-glucose:tetrahydrobiopterin glucosyltransferase
VTTRRVVLVSTPVGPVGSGIGGGVELTLYGIARGLAARGHQVTIVAPAGSIDLGVPVVQVPGTWQPLGQDTARDTGVHMPAGSVLAAMWDEVRRRQDDTDVVVNFAYDWLPMYLTAFLRVPVAHLVSMGSLSDAVDEGVLRAHEARPGCLACHTRAQADTFARPELFRVVANGLDLARYRPNLHPGDHLGWVGRIAPEKGIGDAFALARRTGVPVKVWGLMANPRVWDEARERYPDAPVTYEGFLPTDQLQAALGTCRALVMTPHWVEAFGNVAIEALACAVPVIAYRRGGPAEIVEDGVSGLLVAPDDLEGLAAAVAQVGGIDRATCRARAEARFSLDAMARRMEAWFDHLCGGPA